MGFFIVQVQGRLALTDDSGTVLGVFDDSGDKRLMVQAVLKTGHNLAQETGGNLATLAGKDFATQTTLALIKDTSGIKKITDPVQVEGIYAKDTINDPKLVIIGGGDTGGTLRRLALDSQGRLVTSPPSSISSTAGFEVGYVTTTSATLTIVRATAYTEPTTNAQRSIASASANDTSAGTGARTVRVTYYDQTGAGPYTETVTLNGTTAVNTVATNICFIEQLDVLTVGSGGTNAGIITLYASTGGTGGTVGTMAAGDIRTFWAHHYVPTGKTMYITGVSGGHNATTAGGGGIFHIKAQSIGVANVPNLQISDFLRAYGQSSTITRTYGTAIQVVGPARVALYVLPEGSGTVTYRGAFDYYEE